MSEFRIVQAMKFVGRRLQRFGKEMQVVGENRQLAFLRVLQLAINADQVETPLFLEFVRERAASRGVTVEQQLETYRSRNLMGASLIPPEAVADLAVLLASNRFRFTTGDILTVDGGLPEAFPR